MKDQKDLIEDKTIAINQEVNFNFNHLRNDIFNMILSYLFLIEYKIPYDAKDNNLGGLVKQSRSQAQTISLYKLLYSLRETLPQMNESGLLYSIMRNSTHVPYLQIEQKKIILTDILDNTYKNLEEGEKYWFNQNIASNNKYDHLDLTLATQILDNILKRDDIINLRGLATNLLTYFIINSDNDIEKKAIISNSNRLSNLLQKYPKGLLTILDSLSDQIKLESRELSCVLATFSRDNPVGLGVILDGFNNKEKLQLLKISNTSLFALRKDPERFLNIFNTLDSNQKLELMKASSVAPDLLSYFPKEFMTTFTGFSDEQKLQLFKRDYVQYTDKKGLLGMLIKPKGLLKIIDLLGEKEKLAFVDVIINAQKLFIKKDIFKWIEGFIEQYFESCVDKEESRSGLRHYISCFKEVLDISLVNNPENTRALELLDKVNIIDFKTNILDHNPKETSRDYILEYQDVVNLNDIEININERPKLSPKNSDKDSGAKKLKDNQEENEKVISYCFN